MSDFYVLYEGTQYEVANFEAGVAKAKELGSSAVLYVTGGSDAYTSDLYAQGVNLAFTGGIISVTGGTSNGTMATGTFYTGFAADQTGTVTNQSILIDGGTIASNFTLGSLAGGSTIQNLEVTFRSGVIGLVGGSPAAITNGWFTGANLDPDGTVTINLLGGTTREFFCSSVNPADKQGDTIINIDGINRAGQYVYCSYRSAPKSLTVNVKSGYVYVLSSGGNAGLADGIVMETPVVINMTGGSIGYLLGGAYNWVSMKGNATINISNGVILNGVLGCGWRRNDDAGYVQRTGDVTINLTGGTINQFVTTGGYGNLDGNGEVFVSGDVLYKQKIYGGSLRGTVTGNTSVTITGGRWEGANAWILGGGEQAVTEGKATVTITNSDVYHVFGAGNAVGANVLGGVEVTVTGSTVHGVLQGGGYKGDVEGGITLTVTDSLLTTELAANYGTCGWVVGASSSLGNCKGDIEVAITGSTVMGSVIGGNDWTTKQEGDVALTISDSVLGELLPDGFKNGDIYLLGYQGTEIIGQAFTASVTDTFMTGAFYLGFGGNYFEGDTSIDISTSTIGDGFYLEYGKFTVDPDTGEMISGTETAINGNLSVVMTDVVVEGDVWGKGRNFDLAKFEEGKGATLAVSGMLFAEGEVAFFDNVILQAGAYIEAGAVTAAALTVTADTEEGLYMLATNFGPQDSVITVVNDNGATLGTVTLSASVFSGSFSAGGVNYTVSDEDGNLKLQVGDAPAPTATGAEVILTITDPNHAYVGATGGWKVQADQTVAWQDISTLGSGDAYLGLGVTAADKAMPDIFVYNADAKFVGAYVTDDTGAVASFASIFVGEAALMQVGIADFNADGVSDLLLRTADGFVGYYADGAFAEVQGLGTEWTVAALGDVDGNGCADVIIAHEAGYVGAYLVGADGSITWADLGNLDSTTAIVGAGDVNGDGTDDVIVQVGADYFGAWICTAGTVTGFAGIGTFAGTVQDIADYNSDGIDDLLFRTADGVVGAALITGTDATTWSEYGALGAEWSTKGVGIL